jgi:hypothetical protein
MENALECHFRNLRLKNTHMVLVEASKLDLVAIWMYLCKGALFVISLSRAPFLFSPLQQGIFNKDGASIIITH